MRPASASCRSATPGTATARARTCSPASHSSTSAGRRRLCHHVLASACPTSTQTVSPSRAYWTTSSCGRPVTAPVYLSTIRSRPRRRPARLRSRHRRTGLATRLVSQKPRPRAMEATVAVSDRRAVLVEGGEDDRRPRGDVGGRADLLEQVLERVRRGHPHLEDVALRSRDRVAGLD